MKIQSFDGGLVTKLRPQFLQLNQGTVYENINNDLGTLAPIKGLLNTGREVDEYFTWFDSAQTWVDSKIKTDWLEYKSVLYSSDRQSYPKKLVGSKVQRLGIEPPEQTMQFFAIEAPASPDVYTATASTSPTTGLPRDVYSYLLLTEGSKLTYVQVARDDTVTELAKDLQALPTPTAIAPEPDSDFQEISFSGYDNAVTPMQVYRYYNRKWYLVGAIKKTETLSDDKLDISLNRELTDEDVPALTGTISYLLTYYNEADGAESGPSPISPEVKLDEAYGSVRITDIPVSDDSQVTAKRLYRVGGSLGVFTLIAELDNSTTEFLDNVADQDAIGGTLPDYIASPAPVGLANLTEAYAMFFGSVGSTLRFTPISKPNDWPELYFIDYDFEITGLAPVANGLLVFTKFKTYIVVGTSPSTLSSYPLSGDQGCVSADSIQLLGSEAVWASTDGICRSSGNRPVVMSQAALGKLSLNPVSSVVYDEVYYLLDKSGILYKVGDGIFSTLNLGVTQLAVANDELYGRKDGVLHKLYQGELATFRYKSPVLTEGSFTSEKVYKKVFIYSTGRVKIIISIDGQVVAEKELIGEDNFVIAVPAAKQRGYFVQFELEGTGEVFEIEYTASPQEKR